jgi:error-prone DNA polymerase
MLPEYAELHCLSNFTFLRGASHPEELVAHAQAIGYSALALTDECSVAGVVRAHVAAKDCRLPFIVGAEVRLDDGPTLVLLATDRASYGELCGLITLGRRRMPKGGYRLTCDDLTAGLPGCIALYVPGNDIAEAIAETHAGFVSDCFPGRAWIAAELLSGNVDRAHLAGLMALGDRIGMPLVAAGNVHMHVRSRRPLQDVLTGIRVGAPVHEAGYALNPNAERHLRRRARLARVYPRELLANTLEIARLCTFDLDSLRYEYPAELVPEGHTAASHLRMLTEIGLRRRFPAGVSDHVRRLIEHELSLIAELKYEHFFLTVHDIVNYARSQEILCQGRGSAANSAVCYALGITEVDPSRMSMLFERFISRERNEPPDIDVDFEHQRREDVIQYIYGKYGHHRAALAATVITYQPKSALRDVGKALGMELAQVDRITKSLAWWDNRNALQQRLVQAGFDPESPRIQLLLTLTGMLLGFPRHLSQHVGGFVISRGPLSELVPVENAAMENRTVIQWDKDDLDALGLLKVDVLALGMLSAIRRSLDMINRNRHPKLRMQDIMDLGDDPKVYGMIRAADTIGVFQIESRAQMSMLPRLKPSKFYDLVIEVAIVRPGPIQGGMVHPYLARRQMKVEEITYPSPAIREVLERTLGVPIFQEQVMQLAVVAAGFTPGEADALRRSMAAWRRKGGLEHFRPKLIEGMRERGYSVAFAEQIYKQICGFGEYGFPESHSASFALLAYVSSWIKHYEPAAFLAGLLNSQPMGFYTPSVLVQDAQRHGIEVRPADVMVSGWECVLEPVNRYSLLVTRENQREADVIDERSGKTSHPGSCEPQNAANHRATNNSVSIPNRAERHQTATDMNATYAGFTSNESRVTSNSTIVPNRVEARQTVTDFGATGAPQPAVRLGLLMIKGVSETTGQRIVEARASGLFLSVKDLARRAGLNRRELSALAAAGALDTLTAHRRDALWEAAGTESLPPLLKNATIRETPPQLAAPSEGDLIIADYATTGLTLGRHPLALLRKRLSRMRISTTEMIRSLPTGKRVRTAGIVTCRQRPGTANGVVFVTLEDETGHLNVIVWASLVEKQRRELLGSHLLGVEGVLQNESGVVHLVAHRLTDHSRLLGRLGTESRDFH